MTNKLNHMMVWMVATALLMGTAESQADGWSKQVPASPKPNVTVVLRSGDVKVTGWARQEVKLEAEGNQGPQIKVEGDSIHIGAGEVTGENSEQRREAMKGAASSWFEEDLELHLPKDASLTVITLSGNVSVQQLTGRCRIKSVSGEVRIESCKGPVDVKTVSGDVSVKDVRSGLVSKTVSGELVAEEVGGELIEAKSVSGEIDLRNATAKQLRLKSHSGDICYRGNILSDGSMQVNTFSGDILIGLPPDIGFQLNSRSRSGDVKVDFSLQNEEKSQGRLKGRAGKGGCEVELKTFSGDIVLRAEK